jgi:uncharacterized protein (DUF433 family)
VCAANELRFTKPRYTAAEAARYVGMAPSTLASWANGYTKHFANRPTVKQNPVITSLPSVTGSGATIPFIGLVEATVVQAFRQTGLPLQRVRRALQVLADQGEPEHALASKRLYNDGAQVLYDYASTSGDQMLRLLTVIDSGQRVFHEVISHYLRRISFDDTWATGLILPVTSRDVLRVRPTVASGDPLFLHGGAPLHAVVSRSEAGESMRSIAEDYEVPLEDIEEALGAVLPQAA